jgi:hypothetical protein
VGRHDAGVSHRLKAPALFVRRPFVLTAACAFAGCGGSAAGATPEAGADAPRDAPMDTAREAQRDAPPVFDSSPACPLDDAGQCVCVPDARGFAPVVYHPVQAMPGSCTFQEATAFAGACAAQPSSGPCAAWLGAHPPCGRCLIGQTLEGPLRRDAFNAPEISPGTCGQVLAGEAFDASADAGVDGCGLTLENVGACMAYACAGCDAGQGCRAAAYSTGCATPDLARCAAFDSGACVLGSPTERAQAIAWAVCGGDAGAD